MKNAAIIYSIALTISLVLALSLAAACAQPKPGPVPAPPTPPTPPQPPATVETQPPEETPIVSEHEEEWYAVGTFSGKGNDSLPPFHIYGTQWRIIWTIDAEYPEDATMDLLIYLRSAAGTLWKTVPYTGGSSGAITYFVDPGGKRDFYIAVIARYLQQWTITVEDNATAPASSPIQITYIRYRGTVYAPNPDECRCYERVEPDEYVVIKNLSESPQAMGGWVLKDINQMYPVFTFPLHFVLQPGQVIRVYTDAIYPECEGWRLFDTIPADCAELIKSSFTFNYGYGDIWDNEKPDIAVLYNDLGQEVSRKSYSVPTQIGGLQTNGEAD